MLSEPVRWIHAADLRLDHQLHGVGPVPAALRPVLQNATLTAFGRLITECLKGQLDFLLLGGQTLEPSDVSLAACLQFVEGCERLAEANIPVLWAGTSAEADCLARYGLALPANVIRLDPGEPEPVEFERDGRVAARVHVVPLNSSGEAALRRVPGRAEQRQETPRQETPPCEIVWLQPEPGAAEGSEPGWLKELAGRTSTQYWAWGGSRSRWTQTCGDGTAHHPGGLQGIDAGARGSHGSTLVEFTPQHPVRLEFLPLAPVRWEPLHLQMDGIATREALLERLWETLQTLSPEPGEDLRLLECVLQGSSPLLTQFQAEPGLGRDLAQELFEALDDGPARCWIRAFRSATAPDFAAGSGKLAAEYLARLPALEAVEQALRDKLAAPATDAAAGNGRLSTLLDTVDLDAVLQSARHWGAAGFEMESEAA